MEFYGPCCKRRGHSEGQTLSSYLIFLLILELKSIEGKRDNYFHAGTTNPTFPGGAKRYENKVN
jgi:hypothetical protein